MKVRIVATFTVALAGCAAPGYWNHSDHQDQARFQRDAQQCVYESNLATASSPSYRNLNAQISQDIATGMRQGELQRLCMQARGYYWQQSGVAPAAPQPYVAPRGADEAPTNAFSSQAVSVARDIGCQSPNAVKTGGSGDAEMYAIGCAGTPTIFVRCVAGQCETR